MITLTIIAAFILMLILCVILGAFMEFGWILFIIIDIAIAVKFLCWLFSDKKDKTIK